MEENFRVFDLHRIFIGDAPWLFFLEIVFRTFIMYAYTVFLLRLLGKREMGQLSVLELAIIISFGSAVGDPMIGVNVPVLYGLVAITSIAIFQTVLESLINKNKKMEVLMEGTPNLVVENGRIDPESLHANKISREDLFRALRGKNVEHLGQVKKAFFETTGQVSVFFHAPKHIKPGLTVEPENAIPGSKKINKPNPVKEAGYYCCTNCGNTQQFDHLEKVSTCEVCPGDEWIKAVS